MQFAMLSQKFKTNVFVVYCDPSEDPVLYKRLLKSLVRARKIMPINLTPSDEGELQKQSRQSDVLYVLSSIKALMPVLKLHEDGAQGVFVKPDEQYVDLLETTLTKLETIEGLPREEFIAKAKNAEEEFALLPTDDESESNKKDTQKMIYNPSRFRTNRMYQTSDLETLTDPEKVNDFVKAAVSDQLPLYWETSKVSKSKYSRKLVGEDFEKKVFDAKRDTLLFIKHPDESKNRNLSSQFEDLSRQNSTSDLVFARYSGLNESSGFKSP